MKPLDAKGEYASPFNPIFRSIFEAMDEEKKILINKRDKLKQIRERIGDNIDLIKVKLDSLISELEDYYDLT